MRPRWLLMRQRSLPKPPHWQCESGSWALQRAAWRRSVRCVLGMLAVLSTLGLRQRGLLPQR